MRSFLDIQKEIRKGKNIDVYVRSEDKFVRKEVALAGYYLHELKTDPAYEVRAEVAKKGYALDELTKDKDDWVRFHAMETLQKLNSHNAGYDIINRMDAGNSHFALGYNSKAPAPYVTWEADPDKGTYNAGHYFGDYASAFIDLTKRTANCVDLGERSLGMELLTEEDRQELYMQQINDRAKEEVEGVLTELIEYDALPYDKDALLNDKDFMEPAIHRYFDIDHSAEYEALKETIEDLMEQYPQHKKNLYFEVTEAVVKLFPEQKALINDLLSKTVDEIKDSYGPIGDNIEFKFDFGPHISGSFEIMFPDTLLEGNQKPYIEATLRYDEHVVKKYEIGHDGDFSGSLSEFEYAGQTFTVTFEEDESLKRVGNQFVFCPNSEDERYCQHDGEICTILEALSNTECDMLLTGFMWKAQFPNGDVLHVFEDELSLPPEKQKEKESLSDKIQSAQAKIQTPSQETKTKENER